MLELLQILEENAPREALAEKLDTLFPSSVQLEAALEEIVSEHAQRSPEAILRCVQGVFLGSPIESVTGTERRSAVLEWVVQWLETLGFSDENDNHNSSDDDKVLRSVASKTVQFLITEMDSIPPLSIITCTQKILNNLRTKPNAPPAKSTFDLLPKFIQSIAFMKAIQVMTDSGNEEILTGIQYKDYLVGRLVAYKWSNQVLVPLATCFHEITLNDEQLELVINKLLRQLNYAINLHDIPLLVHQLLLLSRKGQKQLILEGLSDHFNAWSESTRRDIALSQDISEECLNISPQQLAEIEGSVIIELCLFIRQYQELGAEFLKYVKATKRAQLTYFNMMVLLSIARIHSFEDAVLAFLKTTVLNCFKDRMKLEGVDWIRDYSCFEVSDIGSVFMKIIKRSSQQGLSMIAPVLVKAGLLFLDAAGGVGGFGKSDKLVIKRESDKTSQDFTMELGVTILVNTFKVHESTRNTILDEIIVRLLSKTTSPTGCISVLERIGKEAPQTLASSMSKIVESIPSLVCSSLSSNILGRVFAALQPGLRVDPEKNLRKTLLMELRKAALKKNTDHRLSAATAFMQLLLPITPGAAIPSMRNDFMAMTQRGAAGHVSGLGLEDEDLAQVLGTLRYLVASSSSDVRRVIYEGIITFCDTQTAVHGDFMGGVGQILSEQFAKYFNFSGDGVSFTIKPCVSTGVDEPRLLEPLHTLIRALSKVTLYFSRHETDTDDASPIGQGIETMLDALVMTMKDMDFPKYDVGPNADFNKASRIGLQSTFYAQLLLGTFESCIEYVFYRKGLDNVDSQLMVNLLGKHGELLTIVQDSLAAANTGKGKKSSSSANSVFDISTLPLSTLTDFIQFMYTNSSDASAMSPSKSVLVKSGGFVRHIITNTHAHLTRLGSDFSLHNHQTFRLCALLSNLLLVEFVGPYALDTRNRTQQQTEQQQEEGSKSKKKEKEKGKTLFATAVECFALAFGIICEFPTHRVHKFIRKLVSDNQVTDTSKRSDDELVFLIMKNLHRFLSAFVTDRQQISKSAMRMMHCISGLSRHLTRQEHRQYFVQWCQKFAVEKAIDDTAFAKAVLSGWLGLVRTVRSRDAEFDALGSLVGGVHACMGVLDDGEEAEEQPTNELAIVNSKTALTVLNLVLSTAETFIEEIEWSLNQTKGSTNSRNVMIATQANDFHSHIELRLLSVVELLGQIEKTHFPTSNCDVLFKVLIKFFKLMTRVVRMKNSDPSTINERFIAAVEKTCSELTRGFYQAVLLLQQLEQEEISEKNAERREKLEMELEKGKGKGKDKGKGKAGAKEKTKGKGKDNQGSKKEVKIQKEIRLIPNLIYTIETFERHLILLSKKKGVQIDLSKFLKRSTTRDFRIQWQKVSEQFEFEEMLAEAVMDDEEDGFGEMMVDEEGGDANENNEEGGPRKRKRLAGEDDEDEEGDGGAKRKRNS